eukprot:GHRR01006157.1.p1 GENE.GHRR01006157.1~~GHRR01006157.1.p1  ORF type:complete len:164 (+),score=56.52 GHRR01006157.1:977-1468(+)
MFCPAGLTQRASSTDSPTSGASDALHAAVTPVAPIAAAGMPPMGQLTSEMLAQDYLAGIYNPVQSAVAVAPASCLAIAAPPLRKPGTRAARTPAQVEAAVERIKQKPRESAQRSRARRNEYMRQLEEENQQLRSEVQRLQNMLVQVQHGSFIACQQQGQMLGI